MKFLSTILAAAALVVAQPASAEDIDFSVGLGYGIGATTPLGLPATIRSIGSYSPGPNLSIGVDGVKMLSSHWGAGLGVSVDNLGMNSGITTRNYHLTMDITEGSETGTRTGYYTGRIKNKTRLTYLTIPVYAVYRPTGHWQLDFGAYVSYALHRSFEGQVSEGRMREDPLHPLIAINHARYDYSDDLRKFDTGLRAGASMHIWRKLAVRASLRWGIVSVLNPSTRKINLNTYNIYLNLGLTYTI